MRKIINLLYQYNKRAFDIVFSLIGIILLAPLFLAISIAIKIESNGPIYYRGDRIGKNGIPFEMLKFRSMVTDAESLGGSTVSTNDMRVTKVGKFIRKYKIDELTQLFNILWGDMSFVGPRPQVKWVVDRYSEEEKKTLRIRPGITDWASIKFRNQSEIIEKSGYQDPDEAYLHLIHPEKMRLQLKYLEEQSFWLDIKLIILTISPSFVRKLELKQLLK